MTTTRGSMTLLPQQTTFGSGISRQRSRADYEELRIKALAKSLRYKEFFRRSQKLSNKGFNHFFLSQELRPENDSIDPPCYQDDISMLSDLDAPPNSVAMIDRSESYNSSNASISSPSKKSKKNRSKSEVQTGKANFILEFSHDGKYLASAGDEGIIRIWEVISSSFDRKKCTPCGTFLEDDVSANQNSLSTTLSPSSIRMSSPSPSLSPISLRKQSIRMRSHSKSRVSYNPPTSPASDTFDDTTTKSNGDSSFMSFGSIHSRSKVKTIKHPYPSTAFAPVFKPSPIKKLFHDDTVLSVSWSKNNFLLSSSEDGVVKLWHVDHSECLRTLKLSSFATAIRFHDNDDRFFVCCEWDGTIFFYSILEKRFVYKTKIDHHITCMEFSPDMENIYVGCENGYLYILSLTGLKKIGMLQIRHKNQCPRITGIKSCICDGDVKVLITTNDSKIRLFSLTDHYLEVKYIGTDNEYSMIKANSNEMNQFVICGSEDGWTYIWKMYSEDKKSGSSHSRHLRRIPSEIAYWFKDETCKDRNKQYGAFHIHHTRCNVAIFAPRTTSKLLELSNDPIFDLKNIYGPLLHSEVQQEVNDLSTAIIVTTDNKGIIRVLRRDFAYYIRKAIISRKGAFKEVLSGALAQDNRRRAGSMASINLQVPTMSGVPSLNIEDTTVEDSTLPNNNFEPRGRYSSFAALGGRGHANSVSATRFGTANGSKISLNSGLSLPSDTNSTLSLNSNDGRYSSPSLVKSNNSHQNESFKDIDEQIRQLMTKSPKIVPGSNKKEKSPELGHNVNDSITTITKKE